jgi:hypothetical protein
MQIGFWLQFLLKNQNRYQTSAGEKLVVQKEVASSQILQTEPWQTFGPESAEGC